MKITSRMLQEAITEVMDDFVKQMQMNQMYDRYANRNSYDLNGAASMYAQGNDEMAGIAQRDRGIGEYNPYDEEGELPAPKSQVQPQQYRQVTERRKPRK